MNLTDYIDSIVDFQGLTSIQKIKYMSYFFSRINEVEIFKAKDIQDCFDKEHLVIPNNIVQHISNNCKGKQPIFINKKNGCFTLNREIKKSLDNEFGINTKPITLSDNLFPLDLFKNTRGYIEKTAIQASICYDYNQNDAALVMIRRLLETLIIETYEKHEISNEIKDNDGNFFMLGQLVDNYLISKKWNLGRTTKQFLPTIKKLADTSAHNRRFLAKKTDIDNFKNELRIIVEEILHIINF